MATYGEDSQGEKRAPEKESQPIEFQKDLREESTPRSNGNNQREVALFVLDQR